MSCPYSGSSDAATAPHPLPPVEVPEQNIIPIPQPPPHFLFGNLKDIDPNFLVKSLWQLAELYGPIYKLNLAGRELVVLSNHELIKEACDPTRFEKFVGPSLNEVRALAGNGLFTAHSDEKVSIFPMSFEPQTR